MQEKAIAICVAILWLVITGFFLSIGFWGGRKLVDRLETGNEDQNRTKDPEEKEAQDLAAQLGAQIDAELKKRNGRNARRRGVPLA